MKKVLALMIGVAAVVGPGSFNEIQAKGEKMTTAKSGDTVKLHYTGTLGDGSVFDSSEGRSPLEFKVGSGQVIPGFDKAVTGMKVDEEKTFTIPAKEAYGTHDPKMINDIDRKNLPADIKLEKGIQLHARDEMGRVQAFTVVSFDDKTVKLDANHALAGKDLTFKVKLVSIN